jgi:hypothetical protein
MISALATKPKLLVVAEPPQILAHIPHAIQQAAYRGYLVHSHVCEPEASLTFYDARYGMTECRMTDCGS